MAKNNIYAAIAFVAMILSTVTTASAQSRNLKTDESQQLLSVGGGLEWRGSEMGYSSSLSYINFEENSHLLWGGEFEIASSDGFIMPGAYIEGGAHVKAGNVRFYAAGRVGISSLRAYEKTHNDYFEVESSQRQFAPSLGAQAGVQYQGRVLGIGVVVSYDYQLHPDFAHPTDMIVDEISIKENPLSVGVRLSYNLQSGVMRRCGDYPWLVESGYIIALGESTPRAYVKIGQSLRQSARWNGEWSMILEENYSESYSAAMLAFEESFFLFGSNTWVRPCVCAKAGFANVLTSINANAVNDQPGGTGTLAIQTKNMQPGFCFGGYAGVNIRLFSALEAKVAFDFSRRWNQGSTSSGFDEATYTNEPSTDLGIRLGMIWSF